MLSPIDYFNKYSSNDLFEQIVHNAYTVQTEIHFPHTNAQVCHPKGIVSTSSVLNYN